jgi:hypothetical protein
VGIHADRTRNYMVHVQQLGDVLCGRTHAEYERPGSIPSFLILSLLRDHGYLFKSGQRFVGKGSDLVS